MNFLVLLTIALLRGLFTVPHLVKLRTCLARFRLDNSNFATSIGDMI